MTSFADEVALRAAAARLDRRGFLRLAAALATAGLGAQGCASAPEALAPPPGDPLHVLGPRTYAVFTAATARLVGPAGAALIANRRVDVGRIADGWLVRTPALAAPLVQALWVLELGIPPLVDKLRPFTTLASTAQDRVLQGLMTSRFALKRQLFGGVRSLAMLAFYSTAESRVLTGYPGPFGSDAVTIADAMEPVSDR